MATRIEAIYENGVLRPVTPLALAEHERVTLTIESDDDDEDLDHAFIAECKAKTAARGRVPTFEEMQDRLRHVPGSFAELIIQERGER